MTGPNTTDREEMTHNPKVVGSNPTPATSPSFGPRLQGRISCVFMMCRCFSTGLSTGLSGEFLGCLSTLRMQRTHGDVRPIWPLRWPFEVSASNIWATAPRCVTHAYAKPYSIPLAGLRTIRHYRNRDAVCLDPVTSTICFGGPRRKTRHPRVTLDVCQGSALAGRCRMWHYGSHSGRPAQSTEQDCPKTLS